jgi:two-component system NtrC family sensor kinase
MEIERRFTANDGRVIWVSSRVSALRDHNAGGRLIGYMDVLRDITERKRMEAQIRTAQARLAQTARLAAIGDLASGIAHHINNPLTTIIAEAQILLTKLEPSHPFWDSIEAVEKAGWRVQSAVQRLIEFAQPAPDTIESISINDTIEKAVALVDELLRARRINLDLNLVDNLPWIRSNPSLLGDLWVNLLMFTRNRISDNQSHVISIRSRTVPDGTIWVDITDDGKPLSEEEAGALLDINVYQSYDRRNTGLELIICQEIVQQHRGRLSIERLPERGTIIHVSIPVEV